MYTVDNLTRVNNDVNGNPRYVIHYLALLTEQERSELSIVSQYSVAVAKAKNMFGGKKFHNKQYGGGIVFQSYEPRHELALINALHPAEKTYECKFVGRGVGSIGVTFPIVHTVKAQSEGHARANCYNCFEHITDLKIAEVKA